MNDEEYKVLKVLWKSGGVLDQAALLKRFSKEILEKLDEKGLVIYIPNTDEYFLSDTGDLFLKDEMERRKDG